MPLKGGTGTEQSTPLWGVSTLRGSCSVCRDCFERLVVKQGNSSVQQECLSCCLI
jgi:hypothetical protein